MRFLVLCGLRIRRDDNRVIRGIKDFQTLAAVPGIAEAAIAKPGNKRVALGS